MQIKMEKGDEEVGTNMTESIAQSQLQFSGSNPQIEPSKIEVGTTAWFIVIIEFENYTI